MFLRKACKGLAARFASLHTLGRRMLHATIRLRAIGDGLRIDGLRIEHDGRTRRALPVCGDGRTRR
jgi:hypothetical protein